MRPQYEITNIIIMCMKLLYSLVCMKTTGGFYKSLTGPRLSRTTRNSTTCEPWAASVGSAVYCSLNAACI